MAGRKLRRQRDAAIAALSDDKARELAAALVRQLNDSQVLILLVAARTPGHSATMPEAREAAAALIASDPASARLVVALYPHSALVDRALGIQRTPGQQLR